MLDPKYIITLQGREFVRYEGLLSLAHERGLVGIRTQLLQAPSEANNQTAICFAEVTFRNPDTGVESVFTGIGDASPANVSRNIVPHAIRMAETRSKARALRDGTNVGMTALEELDGSGLPAEGEGPSPQASKSGRARSLSLVEGTKVATAKAPAELATKAQIDRVTKEMKRTGYTPDQGRAFLMKNFGKSSRLELSQTEIETFIQHLKDLPDLPATGN